MEKLRAMYRNLVTFVTDCIVLDRAHKIYGNFQQFLNLLHPNVQIDPNAENMLRRYGIYRTVFMIGCQGVARIEHVVPSLELSNWSRDELKHFQVTPTSVDRIYKFKYNCHRRRSDCDHFYNEMQIYARVRYTNNAPVYLASYIQFRDFHDKKGKDSRVKGYAFICTDAKVFMNICRSDYQVDEEFFSMDGIDLRDLDLEEDMWKKYNSSIYFQASNCIEPYNLSFHCYETINRHEKQLKKQINKLPLVLIKNIKKFGKIDKYVKAVKEYKEFCHEFKKNNTCSVDLHQTIIIYHHRIKNRYAYLYAPFLVALSVTCRDILLYCLGYDYPFYNSLWGEFSKLFFFIILPFSISERAFNMNDIS